MTSLPNPEFIPRVCPEPVSPSEDYLDRGLWELTYVSRLLDWSQDSAVGVLESAILLGFSARRLDEIVADRGLRPEPSEASTAGSDAAEIAAICELEARQQVGHGELLRSVHGEGVRVVEARDLDPKMRSQVRDRFEAEMFPLITPQTSGPAHPFPVVSSGSLNLLVNYRSTPSEPMEWARIKIPRVEGSARFMRLQDGSVLVPLESVVADNLDLLFPEAVFESHAPFRVTRHSQGKVPVREGRCSRPVAPAARLEVTPEMSATARGELALHLGLGPEQTSEVAFLALCDWELAADSLAFLD